MADTENGDGNVEDVGSLTIRIRCCEPTGEVRANLIPAEKYGKSHSGKVSERSKKNGYHFVSYVSFIHRPSIPSDSDYFLGLEQALNSAIKSRMVTLHTR